MNQFSKIVTLVFLISTLASVESANAQSALYRPIPSGPTIADFSLIHPQSASTYRRNDLIHVSIDERVRYGIDARSNRRKQRSFESGFSFGAENQHRSSFRMQYQQSLKGSLQARIVEVEPNGNLVIDGSGTIGIISPHDLDRRTRTVRSDRIANGRIYIDR